MLPPLNVPHVPPLPVLEHEARIEIATQLEKLRGWNADLDKLLSAWQIWLIDDEFDGGEEGDQNRPIPAATSATTMPTTPADIRRAILGWIETAKLIRDGIQNALESAQERPDILDRRSDR